MNPNEDFKKVQKLTAQQSSALVAVIGDPQFDAGQYIADPHARAAAVSAAALKDPLFSALGERGKEVAMGWAHELKQYVDIHGSMPSDQLLSSAYQQLKNIVEAGSKDDSGMLLSALNANPMSQSSGIEVRANTAALILPVLLANPMNDAVVYVPNPAKYWTEIFNIVNVAGSNFGDFKKGDIIGPFSSGQYSSMRQRYPFQTVADGAKTSFVFDIAATPAGKVFPIKRKSVRVLVGKKTAVLDAAKEGNPAGSITLSGVAYTIALTIDYTLGKITATSNPALPVGTDVHAVYSVDIEKNPDNVPLVEQHMEPFSVYPFERYIGADSTIESTLKSMSEFGINSRSTMVSAAKTWLANEKALMQLADMMFFAKEETTFNATLPASGEWKEAYEALKAKLVFISNALLKATEESGLAGMYASSLVLNFLRMLPAEVFQIAPGFTDDKRIQYAGLLMGQYKVFSAPFESIVPEGKALCYAKGVNVGKGAYITGDVVPPMVLTQTAGRGTQQQDTIMSLGYDEIHPNGGENYLHILSIENFTLGEAA